MRYWLTHLICALTMLCLAGAALIAAFSLGIYTWSAFLISAVIGLALGLPLGWWITRAIKKDDPNWRARRPA